MNNRKDGATPSFFHKYNMWFNLFKHKKKEEESKTFDGVFISDDEIKQKISHHNGTSIQQEFKEIDEMMNNIKKYVD